MTDSSTHDRRKFLKLVGGGAVLLPIAALSACSGDKDTAPASAPAPADAAADAVEEAVADVEAAAEDVAEAVADATPGDSDMPKLSETDPQAKALMYVHDANDVDRGKNPRYKQGQLCSNCALYQGKEGSQWGGCSIFPGRAVNADGWCNVYAPKQG